MSTSLPKAFSDRMSESLGDDFVTFESVLQGDPLTSIRINPSKSTNLDHLEINGQVSWNEDGRYLSQRPVFTLDPSFHAGAYYVQEASSMSIIHAIRQWIDVDQQPLRILDLCAAPGGKTTSLTALGSQHLIIANEVIKTRYGILRENLERWGTMNKIVTNSDVNGFATLEGYFDIVLVDAPCSGEGLFRKDPKACAEWSPDNVNLCADRQKRILAGAQQLVKPNGLLVYCTCTYNDQENMDNVDWLLNSFDLDNLPMNHDDALGIETVEKNGHVGYQFYPHRLSGEGFFLSGFRKSEGPTYEPPKKRKKQPKGYYQPLNKKHVEILEEHLRTDSDLQFFVDPHDEISMVYRHWWPDVQLITELLRKNSPGAFIGSMKRDDFVPAHGLAMAGGIDLDFPVVDVDRITALHFLKRENMDLNLATKGWHLIRYNGLNLGWVKVLPNRINNYLPKHLRIRMDIV